MSDPNQLMPESNNVSDANKRTMPDAAIRPETPAQLPADADAQLDATLLALSRVQPPARMEQRIHARLAQRSEQPIAIPFGERLVEALSWPRAAIAAGTFAAGALTAALVLPFLHFPTLHHGVTAPAGVAGSSVATPTGAAPVPVKSVEAKATPTFTVKTPSGRAAGMNSASTVASVRSRREHSDTQLAANRRDHKSAQARLIKPAKPTDAAATQAAETAAPPAQ